MDAGPLQSAPTELNDPVEVDGAVEQDRLAEQSEFVDEGSPLEGVLRQTEHDRSVLDAQRSGRLPRGPYRTPQSIADALVAWFALPSDQPAPALHDLALLLSEDLAEIDRLLNDQVNEIIHHEQFQHLEAAWRGLALLVEQLPPHANVQVKVLNASWKDLSRDFTRAVEFDQSQLFQKVYEEGIGMAGSNPFSVLIGDYRVGRSMSDIETLQAVSGVAAAAFAPFIASADSSLFDLDHFGDLERQIDLDRTFSQPDFLAWRRFRETEDARFVGLTLPSALMRLPYTDDVSRVDGFRFREDVSDPNGDGYLWGNPAYAYGGVLIRAFSTTGWLADVRGVRRDEPGGGIVQNLPVHSFNTDRTGVAIKSSTDVAITDQQEKQLTELGFIPLCHCPDTPYSCFYGSQSVQSPRSYSTAAATANARISAMLHYILCASRFAHYLKVLARDKIGSMMPAEHIQGELTNWISQYVRDDDDAAISIKARYPLREARVEVTESPDRPGCYACSMHLLPHFQLDALSASLRLSTELAPAKGGD